MLFVELEWVTSGSGTNAVIQFEEIVEWNFGDTIDDPVSLSEVSSGLPVLQRHQVAVLNPILIGQVIDVWDQFCGSVLYLFKCVNVFLQVWTPSLHAVIQMWSDKRFVESDDGIHVFKDEVALDHTQHLVCLFAAFATCLLTFKLS